MKHTFTILLTACILMIIGVALLSRLDISNRPLPRQGKTLTISYRWQGVSAKVVEQNVTSRIEGLVSGLRGVQSVSSTSYFGSGTVVVELKPKVSVAGVKFEIASLLRQFADKLPSGVSFPELTGGEVVSGRSFGHDGPILSFRLNADFADSKIKDIAERSIKPEVEKISGISRVDIEGGTESYTEISYDARHLALYGITSHDIEEAVRNFMGRQDVVGNVVKTADEGNEHTEAFLIVDDSETGLESIPVKNVAGKIIYLNNLARCTTKYRDPDSYYRVNGMNTVYLNVYADDDANISNVADEAKRKVEDCGLDKSGIVSELTYDKAEEQMADFRTLVVRTAASLVLLLLFVYLCRRSLKYLFVVASTLLLNIMVAVICYVAFGIRIEPYSMAGITVSLGLIIDATIVMADHYSYHHDFKVCSSIVCAMLTTIGSLLVIPWLPQYVQDNMYGFVWTIIINLTVALIVSIVYVPALVSRLGYDGRQNGKPRHLHIAIWWNRLYSRYLHVSQHRLVRPMLLVVAILAFAWSLKLFVDTVDTNQYTPEKEETKLHIVGRMPLGGTPKQLDEKVRIVEEYLAGMKDVRRFETNIGHWGAEIVVEFHKNSLDTNIPYLVENRVVGKLITIGGADWSTWG